MSKDKLLGWNVFTVSLCITFLALASLAFLRMNDESLGASNAQEEIVYMKEKRSDELNQKLEHSWQVAIGKFGINEQAFNKFDWFDTDLITMNLQEPESSNLNDGLTNALNEVREAGDLVPVVLTTPDLAEIFILFQRDEGQGKSVKLKVSSYFAEIENKHQKIVTRKWKLDSVEEK
ncbi:hypothetical protein [Brevibacillus sp. HD1.4A]|uniref:hypothetical protein n=1 Tax=Brevibacillus sp. HD1.4A TaxID=2738978 RepID=UPI00156BA2E5|nr:hypothetical protein [Brevibacillus sp. HD1.4A]NRQ53513.1 hypothetical protein [Brevibacillus sp. HD1.4A]